MSRTEDVPPVVNGGEPPFGDPSDEFETADAPLRPSKTDIERHLCELFPPAFVHPHPGAWIEIAFGDPATGGKPAEAEHYPAFDLKGAAEFAEEKNKAGFNTYVGVALRQGKTDSRAKGRANGANVLTASHSWAEFDKQGDDERIAALLKEKDLLTAMTVVTGTTPNLRAHLYFKLAGSATPAELKAANTALKTSLGSDDVQNPDRIMRLAGTINYPSPKKVERGYVAELVTLHLAANPRTYRADTLINLTAGAANPFLEYSKSVASGGRSDDELQALLETSRHGGKWHNSMRDAIATMIGRGWSDTAIKLACAPYCRGGADDPDLVPLIEGAREKWNKPNEESAAGAGLDTEIERLARLSTLEYERQRKEAAEALGFRTSILDRLVNAKRARLGLDGDADSGMQGRAISFPEPEPWPQPVDGALLDEISKAIGEHVIMPETSRDACALWAAHTFLTDATMISPRLAITSPTRGCGKTTALDVISQLVLRPLSAANVSASAIFRVVEGFRPTLMIDEADSFLRDNEELRGVLNSGHRKGGAVLRNVGDDHEPRSFSTYSACAIALIGQLPPTLTDRSVPITLTRRKRDEAITPFRLDRVDHLVVLARKLARWTTDNAVAIAATEPEIPAGIYNRAADNWRPLLAIAEVAGGKWLERGQAAALKGVATDIDDASLLELLLRDIRDIFAKRAANKVEPVDRISSAVLAEALAEIEGRPWAEYGRSEKPITPGKLARLLKPLVIVPENIRIGDKVSKGYLLERFKEAFARYLASEGASEPLQRYKADEMGTSELFQTATAGSDVAGRKCEKPNNGGPCSVVADREGGQGEGRDVCAHCGLPGDLVEVFFSNRPMVRLHRECKKSYRQVLDEGEKDRTGSVEDAPEDRTCAQCNGEIDGTERLVSVSGWAVWLHLECERFWLAALDEGHSPERVPAGPAASSRSFRIKGPAPPDSVCVCCYRDEAEAVLKIASTEAGSKSETLHEKCAGMWFAGLRNLESPPDDNDDQYKGRA